MKTTVFEYLPEENPKTFGTFVGLFNKANDTKISVKQAKQIDELVQLYDGIKEVMTELRISLELSPKESTRKRSMKQLATGEIDREIYQFIYNNPGSSRREIAEKNNMRLQTVCGAISRLLNDNDIFVSGSMHDHETNREVEVLTAHKRF